MKKLKLSLTEALNFKFNVEELIALCHELRIEHENFNFTQRQVFARELEDFCLRHGLTHDLVEIIEKKRPNIRIDEWTFSSPYNKNKKHDKGLNPAAAKKILIIDDRERWLDEIESVIQEKDYDVFKAKGGNEGIRLAIALKPDLILLDIQMADRDGLEVLEEIKNASFPTRIIMVTGHFNKIDDGILFVKAGACDFLVKDQLSFEELSSKIDRALSLNHTVDLHIEEEFAPILNRLLFEISKLTKENLELKNQINVISASTP